MIERTLPQPSGEFEWVQAPWGAALRCGPLGEIATHCFSTRALDIDGRPDERHEGWQQLATVLDVNLPSLVRMRQMHSATVFVADENHSWSHLPEADIAVTADPSLAVSVRVADCVPVLLGDRRTGAVAAVHAGWRGTAAGAVIAAVKALGAHYGVHPRDLVAAVGPSIGPCCYQVGRDLPEHFAAHPDAARWFARADAPGRAPADDRPHLDLWRATRDQLERAGVPGRHIHVCALCTFDIPALLHSYRRDGPRAGRLAAAIRTGRGRTP